MPTVTLIVEDCTGCCCPVEGDLDEVTTGYTACGCSVTPDATPLKYNVVAHTGLTGAGTIPIVTPGFSSWSGVIGTIDIQFYTDVCVTPDGAPQTVDVTMEISCDNDTGLFINVFFSVPGSAGGPIAVFAAGGQFDEAIPNDLACTGGFPFFAQPFLLDSVEVSRP